MSSLICQSVYITGSKTNNLIAQQQAHPKTESEPLIVGNILKYSNFFCVWQFSHLLSHSSSRFSCSRLPDGSHTTLGGCSPMRRSTSPRRKVGCAIVLGHSSLCCLSVETFPLQLKLQFLISMGSFPLGPAVGRLAVHSRK